MLILLAEDEDAVREGIVCLLESEGYEVVAAANGTEALALYRARRPHLLLLDVMMPGLSGYDVCAQVRAFDPVIPILFLTAKDAPQDEVCGLNVGADDYISKTAPEPVKLARIAAALRRAAEAEEEAGHIFPFGRGRVDGVNAWWFSAGGARVSLSVREVEMLRLFARHPGEVFSHDYLFMRFWGGDFNGSESTLPTSLHRLREKLGEDGAFLHTASGKGYYYLPPAELQP